MVNGRGRWDEEVGMESQGGVKRWGAGWEMGEWQ